MKPQNYSYVFISPRILLSIWVSIFAYCLKRQTDVSEMMTVGPIHGKFTTLLSLSPWFYRNTM